MSATPSPMFASTAVTSTPVTLTAQEHAIWDAYQSFLRCIAGISVDAACQTAALLTLATVQYMALPTASQTLPP
jgi:hypothetical protein